MKRFFDLLIVFFCSFIVLLPAIAIAILIKCSSPGPILYWSNRVGKGNKIFSMPKFRTMKIDAPEVATHLMTEPGFWLIPVGSFLRRTSLDEIPQFWSILIGQMSLVGPRPALFNQYDLIALRTASGVHNLSPGLTGWAQINGRDDLSIVEKVNLDIEYLRKRSVSTDFLILWRTLFKILKSNDVSH